jgi:hypothetical protein
VAAVGAEAEAVVVERGWAAEEVAAALDLAGVAWEGEAAPDRPRDLHRVPRVCRASLVAEVVERDLRTAEVEAARDLRSVRGPADRAERALAAGLVLDRLAEEAVGRRSNVRPSWVVAEPALGPVAAARLAATDPAPEAALRTSAAAVSRTFSVQRL